MMKSMMFALAALAAFQAAAITATKEYVDRKTGAIVSNTYTKAETDARIGELAPPADLAPATNYTDALEAKITSGAIRADEANWAAWANNAGNADIAGSSGTASALNGDGAQSRSADEIFAQLDAASRITTNDVCAIVTNVSADWSCELGALEKTSNFWRGHWDIYIVELRYVEPYWLLEDDASGLSLFKRVEGPADATYLRFELDEGSEASTILGTTSIELVRRNALGLARLTDIAPSVSNIVTKAYVEDLGIESGIQEESDPVWSSEKGNYATKQSVSVVSNLAASADTKANTLISYVNGDDVMDVVTNYDSAVHISSRSLRQRVEDGGSNVWRVVWDEMNRWNWFLPQIEYQTNALWSALSEKADRAWGFYDSHTGGWSPDGYLQISAPKILVAAGMAYQRHVTSGGAVWVLESSGLVTEVGGVASNGFFRISDDEGNALFEIVKGNKRTIGSTAGALTTTNIMGVTHLYITYAVEAAEHPTIEAATSLGTPFVSQESVSSPVNVTWTGSTGDYHAEVWPKSASSSLFVRASHEIGGETYIKNTAPTGLDGGLIYNGVKYRVVPYSTGGKTYLTLEAW